MVWVPQVIAMTRGFSACVCIWELARITCSASRRSAGAFQVWPVILLAGILTVDVSIELQAWTTSVLDEAVLGEKPLMWPRERHSSPEIYAGTVRALASVIALAHSTSPNRLIISKWRMDRYIPNGDFECTYGGGWMLCHSHPFDMYVLGIRGSRIQGIGAAYDWTANAFIGPGTAILNSVNGSLHVHPGFAMKARDVLADVKKKTGIDLSVVRYLSTGGHSQGAAVAAVIALQTAGAGRKRVVTMVSSPPFLSWGSLRRFSELMASELVEIHSVYAISDVVANLHWPYTRQVPHTQRIHLDGTVEWAAQWKKSDDGAVGQNGLSRICSFRAFLHHAGACSPRS